MKLDPNVWRRFGDHCEEIDRSPKRLISRLINDYLDKYEQEQY